MTALQPTPSTARAPAAASRPATAGARRLRLAYLTAQYPAVSHTFIRRELREMERSGHSVLRLSIRSATNAPVDPQDIEELARTVKCLGQPKAALALGALRSVLRRPGGFIRAAALARRMSRQSDRGLVRHLAYLVEAAYLLGVLERERIEHVHVHFATNAAAVMRLVRCMGGPTYSVVCHGCGEWDEPLQLDIRGKVADALFVTAISSFAAAQVKRWADYQHWSRIHIVRCTVGEEYLAGGPPIDAACKTLVTVGRMGPEKGQTLLVEAFAKAIRDGGPDAAAARLVIVGDGEMRPAVERIARELGVSDRVEVTGWLPEAQVRRRLIESRAFVLPSFIEGLPVVIMEALALGRPVLASMVAGIPELVQAGRSGWLVPAGEVDAIASAIREILAAPASRLDEMGRVGRDAVRERHSTATEGARLDRLFQEYLGGG